MAVCKLLGEDTLLMPTFFKMVPRLERVNEAWATQIYWGVHMHEQNKNEKTQTQTQNKNKHENETKTKNNEKVSWEGRK